MTKPQPINSDAPRFSFFRRLLDLFAPRLCCICGQRLTPTEEEICISCNLGLPRTGYAASPLDNLLSRRFWGRIPVERCASLYFYKVHSHTKRPVLRLKYMDHPETAIFFGKMMGRIWRRRILRGNGHDDPHPAGQEPYARARLQPK